MDDFDKLTATHIQIERDSPLWVAAWTGLAAVIRRRQLGDGRDLEQLHDTEIWQLTGSYREGARIRHEFRHRNHPVTGVREYVAVHTEGA